jgi:hypothetical protein
MANKKEVSTKGKWFFGWQNIKWVIKELMSIYSSKNSYFSKKRIESGVAFIIAQWGMIFFLLEKHSTLSMGEFLLWAAAEFAVSGYIINKIQSEKKTEVNSTDSTSEEVL